MDINEQLLIASHLCCYSLALLLLTAGSNTLISYNSTTLISINSGKYTQLVDATQLGSWNFRSHERKYHRWNFRSLVLSLPVFQMCVFE